MSQPIVAGSIPYGPRVPDSPMTGGAAGVVSSSVSGGGAGGAVFPHATNDIRAGQLSWSGDHGTALGPYWCYLFCRVHPS